MLLDIDRSCEFLRNSIMIKLEIFVNFSIIN